MAELPQQDPNISICLDDGGDDRAGTDSPKNVTGNAQDSLSEIDAISTLVHSPTTDTLDSVALEPSPSDDESRLEEVEEVDNETLVNTEAGVQANEGDTGVTVQQGDDVEKEKMSEDNTEEVPASQPQSEPVNVEQPPTPKLSNYFGDSTPSDFFDGLSIEDSQSVSVSAPTNTSPRVRHSSQPEPEPVSFECEQQASDNTESLPVENEEALLEKEADSFEAFTAEGSDLPSLDSYSVSPIHHTLGTPRHFQNDNLSTKQDTSLPGAGEHGDPPVPNEGSLPVSQNDGAKTLHVTCSQPVVGSDQHSPVPSPTHHTPPVQHHPEGIILPGSPAPVSPLQQPQSLPNSSAPFQPFAENFLGSTEDPFTASLHMSDAERRRDAWLPSDNTRQVIVYAVTSPPGTYYPSPNELCMPGLVLDDPQGDPVMEMLQRFSIENGISQRQTLSADGVSQDEDGIRKLIEADCLRAAVDLVGRLITTCGQGVGRIGQVTQHSPQTLQLWFLRLTLLTKLRLYSLAESESQAFKNLDTADLYYDYYPQLHPGKRGSMVPFGMRILHANLPHYLGRTQDALDRLYYIMAVVKKILSNIESGFAEDGSLLELSAESLKASLELWRHRELQVLYSIGNCLLYVKDFEAGLQVYETLLEKDTPNHAELLCALGRIYLQMGDIDKAASYFKQFDDVGNPDDSVVAARMSINHGLVALAKNNFNEAYQYFTAARKSDPDNPIAVNNLAVCYLYMGKLKDSLATLEEMIQTNPGKNLHEGVLFNLCTLYELESSRAMQKKQSLLEMVSRHKGDSFPVASLKLA